MMSTPTSSGVNAASTIASEQHFIMNKRRRDLLKACRRARLKQRDILRNTSQIVHTKFGIEDHAETYFTLEGEYGGKTFLQRIEASMKAMEGETRLLEQMIGAQSADIDDELEQKIVTLRDLEREYDTLEKNIVFTSLDQMEEYQVLMKSINRPDGMQSIHSHTDHIRLEEVIQFKEVMEDKYNAVAKKREDQFHNQLKKLQEAYIEGSIKSRLLEQQANQINREIDSYTADMHQHTNNEKENLIKVFHMDEANMHKQYMTKYQALKATSKKATPSSTAETKLQSSREFIDDLIIQDAGAKQPKKASKATENKATIEAERKLGELPWKFEVMERLDHLIEKQEQLRRDEESRNQQVLDAFKSLHPPTTVAKEKVEVTPKLEVRKNLLSILDPTSTTTTKEILSAGLRTDDIQDAETTKNIELIGEMRIKLQQLYMKQNEVGLQQRPTQMPNNNDKAFFPATPGSSKLTRESSFFNDMKSPSYESPDNTPNINSNRKTFFPY